MQIILADFPVGFLQNLGTTDIILIFVLVLLLFGAKRLPELARSMGRSMKEFRNATKDAEETFRSAMEEDESTERKNKPTPAPDTAEDNSETKKDDAASTTEKSHS